MTNIPPNSPPEPPRGSFPANIFQWLKKPSTLIGGGGVLLTLGVAGYAGIQYFVYQRLSPLLSTELSKILQRKVEVGEVKDFYWRGIRFGASGFLSSENDPDYAKVDELTVNYNLFPLLIGQPLKADVTVVNPQVYIEQDKTGKWIELPKFEGEAQDLPIDLDIDVNLGKANVVLVPNGLKKPVTIQAEGQAGYGYQGNKSQQLRYDLDAMLLGSVANLEGETEIGGGEKFGKTQAKILLKELNLGEVVALIPNSPATVKKGTFGADFEINLPSIEGIEGTQGNGTINLSNLLATVKPIKKPIEAEIDLNLDGQKVYFNKVNVSLGKLVTRVRGDLDWQKGLNLDVLVSPVRIPEILRDLNINLPVKLEGTVASKIQVRGKVLDPIISGVFESTKPIIIEQTKINKLQTRFQATLDQVLLSQLEITPADGGKILGKGRVKTDIRKSLEDGKAIDWTKFPIALDFSANLPTQALINPYLNTTQLVTISPLTAKGQVRGIMSRPQGRINWNLPTPSQVAGVGIYGNGEVIFAGETLNFRNVLSQSDGGRVNLDGMGSFKTLDLRANLRGNSFALSPFIPVICRELGNCPSEVFGQDISLNNANINIGTNFNKFNLNKIQGNGTILLGINQGVVDINSNLNQGIVKTKLQANGLNLTPFLPIVCKMGLSCPEGILDQRVGVENAKVNLVANLNNLALNTINSTAIAILTVNDNNIAVNGNLRQGNLIGNFQTTNLNLNPYLSLICNNLSQCPPELLDQDITVVNSKGNIQGNIDNLALNQIQGALQANLQVNRGDIAVNGNLRQGNLVGNFQTGSLNLNPYLSLICNKNSQCPDQLLDQDVTLMSSQGNITGNIDNLDLNRINGALQANLRVNSGNIAVNGNLSQGNLKSTVLTSNINLNPFISILTPDLTIPVNLNQATVNLSASLPQLLQQPQINLKSINLDLIAQLTADNSPITATAKVKQGIMTAAAKTGTLSINRFIPNLPLSADLISSQVNLNGNLNDLLQSLDSNPDLSSFNGNLTANLATAKGKVNAVSRFNLNQFSANIVASGIIPRELCNSFPLDCSQIPSLDQAINASANLKGNLGSILEKNSNLPIKVSNFAANWGEQTIKGNGSLLITNLTQKPDIATANFNLDGSVNLSKLPLEQYLTLIPVKRTLLPEKLALTGLGTFSGQFRGKNLLTAPTQAGNTLLSGNLSLTNFSFNNRQFEPILKGKLQAGLGQPITLNLRGKDDQIAAKIEPCTRSNCLFPYLPANFALKQIYGDETPFIVTGHRKGDRLIAKVDTFPLEWLKIAPLQEFGIQGYLEGQATLSTDINLFNLSGSGAVEVTQPGIGLIQADLLTARLAYDNGIAKLKEGRLVLGKSNYDVTGQLNLRTLDVNGQLIVERGYIQDILNALKISDVQSLITLLQLKATEYASASVLQPNPQALHDNATIAQKVNRLAEIDRLIKEFAQTLQRGGFPTELDIRGAFSTEANLKGNLLNPYVTVAFKGDRWQWQPQSPVPNIVSPLGLITEGDQAIPIRKIHLQASLEDGEVDIKTAGLEVREMIAEVAGNVSLEKINAKFDINSLSLDTIKDFIDIPLDIAGKINLNGQITGETLNPQAEGQFSFVEGALNAQSLNTDIKGQFSYQNARLITQTLNPEAIQLYASIPYPPTPETNDQLEIRANIGTEALKLVNLLTQDQISWVEGEGNVILNVTGKLDTREKFDLTFDAKGQVNLENVTLASNVLPDPLVVNGKINFDQNVLQIDQLGGKYGDSLISISGMLPILQPLTVANPLTVVLSAPEFNLDGLYQGNIEGNIIIKGFALQPIIGGNVSLANGRIFVPEVVKDATETVSVPEQLAYRQWLKPRNEAMSLPIQPTFDNFEIVLDQLNVRQNPLYDFGFGGKIRVNGTLTRLDLNQLQPDGQIILTSGEINLVELRFLTDRRMNNTITFEPNQGIFNPNLNITMRTIVSEVPNSRQRVSEWSNEIPDSSLDQVQRIDVNLAINGQLRRLLPDLGQRSDNICQLHPDDFRPIREEAAITQAELDRLEQCIEDLAILNGNREDFFQNPIVKLTSRPPRPQGEIVRLLGEQFLVLADSLQTGNTEQLLQSGIVQIALPMVFQGVVYDVESSIGNWLGSTDFRVIPFLEAIYSLNPPPEDGKKVDNPTFLRFSYDYNQSEFRMRYERSF